MVRSFPPWNRFWPLWSHLDKRYWCFNQIYVASLLVGQQQLMFNMDFRNITFLSFTISFIFVLLVAACFRKNHSLKWSDYEWNDQKFTGMQRSLMSSPVIKGHFERGSSLHKGCSQAGQLRGRRPNRLPALGSKWTLVRHYLGIIRIQWTNKQSIHGFSQFWFVFQTKRVICFVPLFSVSI